MVMHVDFPPIYKYYKEIKKNGIIYINDSYEGEEIKIISLIFSLV